MLLFLLDVFDIFLLCLIFLEHSAPGLSYLRHLVFFIREEHMYLHVPHLQPHPLIFVIVLSPFQNSLLSCSTLRTSLRQIRNHSHS